MYKPADTLECGIPPAILWTLCTSAPKAPRRIDYVEPEDASAAFFAFPETTLNDLIAARLFERYKDGWRTPKREISLSSSSENEQISDPIRGTEKPTHVTLIFPDGSSTSFVGRSVQGDTSRASHDLLISSTFGFHPLYGTGHILKTNGVVALFWNGEEVAIVEHKNVKLLRPVISGEVTSRVSRRQRILTSAMSID